MGRLAECGHVCHTTAKATDYIFTASVTQVEALAKYAARASFADLSVQSRRQVPVHILDSLGCCIAALGAGPVEACRLQVADFGGDGPCDANPIFAAFWHTALVRYVDFMDNFLAPTETCHTADNFGVALTIAEYVGGTGRDLMLAVALSYTVQSRFVDHANFMTRWKGLASAQSALGAMNTLFLARRGVEGPLQVIEGANGIDNLLHMQVRIDWDKQGYDGVLESTIKKYNAMIHTQSAVHCMVELARQNKFDPGKVVSIEADVTRMTYDFAGGGLYGVDKVVRTKEQADHNLPYLLAVALLDGDVMPAQFEPDRIARADVQQLLKKVSVRPDQEYTGTVSRQDACQGHRAAAGWQGDRARGSGFSRPRFPSVHVAGIRRQIRQARRRSRRRRTVPRDQGCGAFAGKHPGREI